MKKLSRFNLSMLAIILGLVLVAAGAHLLGNKAAQHFAFQAMVFAVLINFGADAITYFSKAFRRDTVKFTLRHDRLNLATNSVEALLLLGWAVYKFHLF